jgi:signal peptidase I
MAPALIGHHRAGPCPRCGYPVRVGRPANGRAAEHFSEVACQNCEFRFSLASASDMSGDQLLVDKNVYSLRSPRRWEMVVFRCPDTDPKEFGKPYVKRLIGLPGETLTIVDGEVFVDGELARKGLAEVRETRLPVFDMRYVPKAVGWGNRWIAAAEDDPRLPPPAAKSPAAPERIVVDGAELILNAADAPQTMARVTYRHWSLDRLKEEPVRAWSAYDGAPRRDDSALPAVHDFILSCEVEVTETTTSEARLALRLMDGADAVSAEIAVGSRSSGQAQLIRENRGSLGAVSGVALEPGQRYLLEFAFVDRQVLFARDGRLVVPAAELEPTTARREVSRPLQIGVRGCRVAIRDLQLFRDIHYTHYGEHGTRQPARLGAKEYFVLGDNSGNSQDSRKWPNPGVPEPYFIGKPFLIHQPLRPGRATVGGREFQTLDWTRMRWLH